MRDIFIGLVGLIGGLGLLIATRPIPEVAFILQGASLGAVIGAAVTYRRRLDGDRAARVVARWTISGVMLATIATGAEWALSGVLS